MNAKYNRILPESEDNVLAVEIGERMTLEDYRHIFEQAAEKIFPVYKEGRLVLKYTKPFLGWDMDAAEKDLSILAEKGNLLTKIALVDPPAIVLPKWEILRPVLGGPVKIFKEDEYAAALKWAKA